MEPTIQTSDTRYCGLFLYRFLNVHLDIEDLRRYTIRRKIELALAKIDSFLREEESLYRMYRTFVERIMRYQKC